MSTILTEAEWSLFGELIDAFRDGTEALEQSQAEVERLEAAVINEYRLTRVTLVHTSGIVWERYNLHVELQVQDDGRTLKVFVEDMEDPR